MRIKNFKFGYYGWSNPADGCSISIDIECGASKAKVDFCVYRAFPDEAQVHVDMLEAGNARGRGLIQKYVERTTSEYAKAAHAFASKLKGLGLD